MASGESKGSRRYDKENLLWQSTVAIRSDPVGSFSGKSIGVKRIRVLESPVSVENCEVRVLKDGGSLQGVSFKLYLADPELVKTVLAATTESGETDTAKWMTAP